VRWARTEAIAAGGNRGVWEQAVNKFEQLSVAGRGEMQSAQPRSLLPRGVVSSEETLALETMKDPTCEWERARAVIRSACMMLLDARSRAPVFVRDLEGLDADFAVLLRDAAQLFCQAVSEAHGEPPDSRWSAELPELLVAHPGRCEALLARVEEGRLQETLEAQFASV
jgi:hypothetical protein